MYITLKKFCIVKAVSILTGDSPRFGECLSHSKGKANLDVKCFENIYAFKYILIYSAFLP